MQALTQFHDLAVIAFELRIHLFRPRVHATAPSSASLTETGEIGLRFLAKNCATFGLPVAQQNLVMNRTGHVYGNDFRLINQVNYRPKRAFILHVLTRFEYNKRD